MIGILEVLGKISYNDQLAWYEAEIDNHHLYLSCEDEAEAKQTLAHTQSFLKERAKLIQQAKAYACDSLLGIKNDSWLEDGEAEVSKEQFIACLKVESVIVYPEGVLAITFLDGDLFWGHVVQVTYENQAFVEVGIAG